jgi:uncharacterized protein YqeY
MSIPDLYQRLQTDLRLAMAARDRALVSVLRTAVSSVDNAGAVESDLGSYQVGFSEDVPRQHLDDAAIREVLVQEIEERREAIVLYTRLDRADHAETLRAEMEILTSYL